MAIVLKDRVKQTASNPGTGTVTLGATATGFQAFSAIGNGNVTYFAIVDPISGAWEVNYGTYNSGTLTRNSTPLSSSNAGALVNFTGTTLDVFCTYPSEKAIYEETTGNVLIDGGPITVIGNGVTSYTTFAAALGEMYANLNSFAQFYAQNLNGGSSASTDFVAYNDLGDGTNNFVDMGISSSNYSDATYPIFTPGSGYVYNNGGEMIIGSQTHDLLLFAGGVATTDWALRVNKTSKLITTKDGLTLGGALTGVGGSFTSPVTTTSSMTSPGTTELVTKEYVDNATSTALTFHSAVYCATSVNITESTLAYNNGVAGVGATLTRTSSFATLGIDGTTPPVGSRVLVRLQNTGAWNGVYTVTNVGSGSTGWVLTRATDADTYGPGANQLSLNDYFYVQNGTVNKGIAYVLSSPSGTIVFGTSSIQFAEFSSSQIYTGTSPIDVTATVISLTTVPATLGGTGTATVTTGNLLYGSGTNTWSKLPVGSAYKSLVVNGAGTLPEWNAVALNQSGAVSGSLPATNGGTGLNSYNVGEMIYSNTTTTFDVVTRNTTTTKKFLTQTGTGTSAQAPVWGTISGSDVSGNIAGSAGSVANALTAGTYLTSTGTFDGSVARTFAVDAVSTNTASKVVARDASGNFAAGTITAALSGNATTATTSTNIAGGAANQIPYQSGAATTSFITAPTTAGTYLGWNGSAFAYSAISLPNSLTINNGGAGAASGSTFNGSSPLTISYNTVGAPSTTGTNASGTWGISITGSASGSAGSVANAVTFNNGGAGDVSGTTFDGSAARTISYNTVGAPSTTGTNASGTWGISISGNAATATNSTTTSQTNFSNLTIGGSQVLYAGNYNSYAPTLTGTGAYGTWGINISGNAATATNSSTTSQTNFSNLTIGGSQVLYAGNYNSYAPTLTGTGATGTWAINISGNAATSSSTTGNAATATILKAVNATATGASTWNPGGLTYQAWGQYFTNSAISADSGDITIWMRPSVYSGGGTELNMYIDGDYYSGTGLYRVLNAGNYNSYAPTLTGTGASGTWGINITGNAATATTAANYMPLAGGTFTDNVYFSNSGTTKRGIMGTVGDNDFWFVGGGATASNTGFMEIATGDDGQTAGTYEPIYVSQYGPGNPLTGTLVRRASLLDNNGNTSFPGTISASSFAGSLATGSGASGTWGISITGSAGSAGSVDFANLTNKGGGTGTYTTNGDYRAPIFYDSNDTTYFTDPNNISSLYGVAVRGDQNSTDSRNQIFFWGAGDTTTSAIGFKANGGEFPNPTGNGDGYNTYLTMDTPGRGWVFRRGNGSSDFNAAETSGWILNNGIWQANASMRAPIFYDSDDTAYYVNPNSETRIYYTSVNVGNESTGGANSSNAGLILRGNYNSNTWAHKFHKYDTGTGVVLYLSQTVGASTWGALQSWGNGLTYTSQVFGSFRANDTYGTIFYDANDTSYYLDPAGTSVLNVLSDPALSDSRLYLRTRGDTNHYLWNAGDDWEELVAYSGTGFRVTNSNGTGSILTCYGNGNGNYVQAVGSMRAPIFYDSDNTARYVDPTSSTSAVFTGSVNAQTYNYAGILVNASGTSSSGAAFAIQQVTAEGWTGVFVDFEPNTGWGLYHDNPNNFFCVTAESSAGSIRSFTVPSRSSGNRTAYEKIRLDQASGDIITGAIAYAYASMRSPIFYDYDNTGYYCDPNNRSNLYQSTFGNGLQFSGAFCLNGSGATLDNSTGARLTESYGPVWNLSNSSTWHHQIINGSSLCGFNASGGNFGSGNILASGNITAYYSDERLKTKVSVIQNALDKVRSLEGFIYVENDLAKSVGYTNSGEQAGVSAQRVKAVLPQAVSLAPFDMTGVPETGEIISKSGKNYLTVDYSRLSPLLIEAIKEQDQEVIDLRNRVAQLESLIHKLIGEQP